MIVRPLLLLLAAASLSPAVADLTQLPDQQQQPVIELIYTNSWAVKISHGGLEAADEIAERHGYTNMGQIGSLSDMYHFLMDTDGSRQVKGLYGGEVRYRSLALESEPLVDYVQQQTFHQWEKKYLQPTESTDPLWGSQWAVNNTGQTGQLNLYLDLNVEPAWIQGYTGNGIVVAVVDDGVEHRHGDLRDNYVSQYSYDFLFDRADPSPIISTDSHGTACAGQIAMTRDNNICGVGVAYESQLAGIRLIGGLITDVTEASALSFSSENIDIYSNSWGPSDGGYFVGGPGYVLSMALQQGAQSGRNGKGNIFTWAAGNGGRNFDSCAADGYSQSIYSISVGAYAQNGSPADYDERCSAKQTVAYVYNTNTDLQVLTLTLPTDRCTRTFTGTSSSTPFVSAVIALTLNANPDLSWRDIQYLIAYTSNSDHLLDGTSDEFVNGAGLTVSHSFGFGAIDAEAMVTRARHWTNVPPQMNDTVIPSRTSGIATDGSPLVITFTYSGQIRYLEHIVVTMSLNASGYRYNINQTRAAQIVQADEDDLNINWYSQFAKRGDISVELTSPNGTTSTLLFNRPYDIVTVEGYFNWPFLSLLHWGENPNGQWTVRVLWDNVYRGSAILRNISVSLYGVSSTPVAVSRIPSRCHSSCARPRGCAAAGAQYCDACNSTLLRNATTRECIQPEQCVAPHSVASGYCYLPSVAWTTVANKLLISVVLIFTLKLLY